MIYIYIYIYIFRMYWGPDQGPILVAHRKHLGIMAHCKHGLYILEVPWLGVGAIYRGKPRGSTSAADAKAASSEIFYLTKIPRVLVYKVMQDFCHQQYHGPLYCKRLNTYLSVRCGSHHPNRNGTRSLKCTSH